MVKDKKPLSVVVLGLSPKAAELVRTALGLEFDIPRADDHSDEELAILEEIISQINEQLPKPKS